MQPRPPTLAVAVAAAVVVVLALLGGARAQCDLQQQVAVGTYYDITSPNYPNNYSPATQCRWRASTDASSRLRLSCTLSMPAATDCTGDRLRISLSGDDSLSDAHQYCGEGSLSLVSDANRLTMVLESSWSSASGGRFLCNITAVASSTCMCGMRKESRIVGGEETGVNEFPFMAGLVDSELRLVYCGATIVSAHYAVTAAHCTVNKAPSTMGLLVGDHDLTSGTETSARKLYKILYFQVHPQYDQNQQVDQDNDIALVRVDGVIAMSREVMPVCLPIRYQDYDFAYSKVVVMGWGTTEFAGAGSNTLLKADLYIQSQQQCSAVYGSTVSYRQMCSYNAGKDACQRDSGGPLSWRDPYSGREVLVGIVSHGVACGTTSPGVNTRVTYYVNWITSVIGAEDQYCII